MQEPQQAAAAWVRIASVSDVPESSVLGIEVQGFNIAIYHLPGGEFCATDNICTHATAFLCDGWLEDGVIECPLHAGRFDARTGKGMGPPIDKDLAVYSLRIEGEDLLVALPPQAPGPGPEG